MVEISNDAAYELLRSEGYPEVAPSSFVLEICGQFNKTLANSYQVSCPKLMQKRYLRGVASIYNLLPSELAEKLQDASFCMVFVQDATKSTSQLADKIIFDLQQQFSIMNLFIVPDGTSKLRRSGTEGWFQRPRSCILPLSLPIKDVTIDSQKRRSFLSCSLPSMSAPVGERISRILPNLYISDGTTSQNRDTLRFHGINAIVNATADLPNCFEGDNIDYLRVPVNDTWNQPIQDHFASVHRFIAHKLAVGQTVLVHCQAGISRSTTLVIAFIIKQFGLCLDCAYAKVKAARTQCSPNLDFMGALKSWNDQLHCSHGSNCLADLNMPACHTTSSILLRPSVGSPLLSRPSSSCSHHSSQTSPRNVNPPVIAMNPLCSV